MRILLTEGSGLTSRQVATRLGQLGHAVEVLSSTPLCLARFTRHVRRVHAVPPFGSQPLAWFEAARAIAHQRHVDVVFPTQEQVTVLSALESRLGVPTLVPPFAALRRVQDKLSAWATLREAGVPQPDAWEVRTAADLARVAGFPVFVKRPIGTASTAVRRATSAEHLGMVVTELGLDAGLLVQREVQGPLAMVQALADRGRLVAFHANLRLREGVGGGAACKESLASPALQGDVARLVAHLGWHGALSLDAILSPAGAQVIDVNPRLVEPMNAWHAGVDLMGTALALALGEHPAPQPPGRTGVRTHQLLLSLLGAAQAHGTRRAVWRELWATMWRTGTWREGCEELTPVRGDWRAAMPVLLAAAATLSQPSAWRLFHSGAVGRYALTPAGWEAILRAAAPTRETPSDHQGPDSGTHL